MTVELTGPGAGTVTSTPVGIDCTNDGGGGGTCEAEFANFAPVELSARPGSGDLFLEWTADDPNGGFVGPLSCNSGSANPCIVANIAGSTVHVTASFGCAPPVAAPQVLTGASSPSVSFALRTLEGQIDPRGCGIEESFFEYGLTTGYGATTPTRPDAVGVGRGRGPVTVSAETEPLEPESIYHYRLVAVGPGGIAKGEDRTFATGSAEIGDCPNEARRLEQGVAALLLPSCMALEMVSPPRKLGARATEPNVSDDGSRVSFASLTALGENPPGLIEEAVYVATRGASGWSSESTLPDRSFSALWNEFSKLDPSFTPDFSRWLGFGATASRYQRGIAQAYSAGLGGFFNWLSEPLTPFSAHPGTTTGNLNEVVTGAALQGASADHSHLYFSPGVNAIYRSGDPSPQNERTVYLVQRRPTGQLVFELLQRDRDGKVWGGECGARLGGIGPLAGAVPPNGQRDQGAISGDGSRTYLSARASQPPAERCDPGAHKLRILERIESPSGPQIVPLFLHSECSRPAPGPDECTGADGDDLYQGASLNQTKVYFTTNRQLVDSDHDGSGAECDTEVDVPGCDLYLYDRDRSSGHRLIQVSAGEEVAQEVGAEEEEIVHRAGSEADVYNGITAISADGSRAYFVATGVLTDNANPAGEKPQKGQPNLYTWDEHAWEEAGERGGLKFVGKLDPEDGMVVLGGGRADGGLWGGGTTWRNNAYPVPILSPAEQRGEGDGEEGGDGHILVFESKADLTADDRDGSRLDVYRFDAHAMTLLCLSCAPGSSASTPDRASFDVEARGEEPGVGVGTDFAERGRWVSDDGGVVGFVTAESLVPGDVDGARDGYLWREGQLTRLPGEPLGGSGAVRASGPTLSPSGSTVAFATSTPLLPQDGDSVADIYVARAAGGFPTPPVPAPCEPGRSCMPSPASAPPIPAVGTDGITGANVAHNLCARLARRARALSRHAKQLRKRASRFARHRPMRARALRRKAHRLGREVRSRSRRARRCRSGSQKREPVNTTRRSTHRHRGRAR